MVLLHKVLTVLFHITNALIENKFLKRVNCLNAKKGLLNETE